MLRTARKYLRSALLTVTLRQAHIELELARLFSHHLVVTPRGTAALCSGCLTVTREVAATKDNYYDSIRCATVFRVRLYNSPDRVWGGAVVSQLPSPLHCISQK